MATPPPPQTQPQTRPVARRGTLYDRLGGESAIRAVVDDLVARAANDPAVNFTRQGAPSEWQATPQNVERLKRRFVEFVATTAGGPQQYSGNDMVTAHKGMAITDREFDALAGHLRAALEANNVPRREREEVMNAVASTRGAIVEVNEAPPATPPAAESPAPEDTATDAPAPETPAPDAPESDDAAAPEAPAGPGSAVQPQ